MELSKLQQEIVTSPEDKIVVIAAAAAGKTRTLTERVRFWLRAGVNPKDICAITFTNVAATEMQQRLGADYKDGIFIGTIHALATRFLRMGGRAQEANAAIESEQFDELFVFIEEYPECTQHYSYVLVDEAQDLSENEYQFIFNMINPEHFFVVGDYRQCIYEKLKQAKPNYMVDLARRPDVKEFSLNENYRNCANILERAKKTLLPAGITDDSKAMNYGGVLYEGIFNLDTLIEYIESTDSYKDWAILCYTNADVQYIRSELEENFIPTTTFNQRKKTKKELDALVNENKVKVLTVWVAKGLGFPNVVVYGYNWVTGREHYRVEYVAYTRAMRSLMILAPEKKNKTRKKKWHN